jgi:O-antigen biosynthesis protein
MKVNILLLTIDRYGMTRDYVRSVLDKTGYPYNLCVTDNGSIDKAVIDLVASWEPKLHIINEGNAGTAQSLNKMIKLEPADAYVFIGNDIRLPQDWLRTMVNYYKSIPDTGVMGIDWRGLAYDKEIVNGKQILKTSRVFGTMFVPQTAIDLVGDFCEDYGTYGLWDSDWSIRCTKAGLRIYYVDGMRSEHMGNDVGEDSEYRKMKDASLERAEPIFRENVKQYEAGNFFKQY